MDNEWLKTAIRLAKSGKKQEAQEILHGLVKRDPADVQAWLWLADAMSTPAERDAILQEAWRHNPGSAMVEQALAHLGIAIPPKRVPQVSPDDLEALPFHISMDELRSLDERIAYDEPPAEEEDWLRALGEAKNAPPGPALASETAFEERLRPVGDPPPSTEPPRALDPTPKDHAADFLDLVYPKERNLPPSTAEKKPTVELPLAPPPEKDRAGDEALAIDALEYRIEEPGVRRRWLGIVFVLILLAVLAAAVWVGWPVITNTLSPLVAGVSRAFVVEPSATPTATLSPTPTSTATITLTPTPTATPVPTAVPTATEISPLENPGIVNAANIQQFKVLGSVNAVGAVSLETRLLAEPVETTAVQVWDFVTGKPRQFLNGPTAAIQNTAFSGDGKWLAAVSEEPAVWVWDVESGQLIASLAFSQDLRARYLQSDFPKTLRVQFSPDNKAVFASSLLGVTWWDLKSKQERHLFPMLPKESEDFRQQALSPDLVTARSFLVEFSPDGKLIAVGSQTKVYILSWPGAGGVATLNTAKALVAMHWMENGLLGLIHLNQASVWNVYYNKLVISFPALKSQSGEPSPAAAFQRNGQRMAVEVDNARGFPGGLQLVDLPGGGKGLTFDPQTFARVTRPLFSLDGSLLFAASGGDMFVWDTTTGKVLRRIANRKGFNALSADGRYFLEVAPNGTNLWGIAP